MRLTSPLRLAAGTVAGAVALLALSTGAGGRDAGTAVALPDRLAGYSYLTGQVSEAPPGRALALYQHGFGVEFLDFPQAVVLAADDDVYRRLDAAEDLAGRETQGDPGPMLLSPDGRWVALGDHTASAARLDLLDLTTGAVDRHAVPEARSVLPVAWSADGRQVAYLAGDRPTVPPAYAPRSRLGDLFVLDLASGNAAPVPGGAEARAAAFSPDGRQLAVQREGPREGLAIVDLRSSTVRALPSRGTLAGANAWSPDGELLAVARRSSTRYLTTTGPRASTAFDRPGDRGLLGWLGDREVVLLDEDPTTDRLVAQSLLSESERELMVVESSSNYHVGRLQLASALVADLGTRVAGEPARGPLPTAFRIAAAVLVGLVVTIVAAAVTRRRRIG